MKNGCILNGGVGSGKSITALYYYFTQQGGKITETDYKPMIKSRMKQLFIITTARKRDTKDWEGEMIPFLMSTVPTELYKLPVVVDSWNNISKYALVENSFFIFDEQRLCGNGKWVKSFLKISRKNDWVLLSATPGDNWSDYIPVFLANGFYRSRKQFQREHFVYSAYTKFPKIEKYINTGRLITLRNNILISMDYTTSAEKIKTSIPVDYDKQKYNRVCKDRWNIYADEPIVNASQYCSLLRKVVNSDESRQVAVLELHEKHPKLIIFYNYNYELDILKEVFKQNDVTVAEWNGHCHEPVPENDNWVYLVQYTAGAEGWNCIKTDAILFYSLNYSFKIMSQSEGRIDRLNTPFKTLYYYYLKSNSSIDLAVGRALANKKKFNELEFYNK